ncbi:MAG: UbiX family flavin prenyltransferase [Armatimonadetes bacterium]|nr:UbiX family flavin prenyltransferase [Armatimonadota bacterium]
MTDHLPSRPSITVGISGGSGAVYAVRLLEILPRYYQRVNIVMSNAARQVLAQEVEVTAPAEGTWQLPNATPEESERVVVWNNQNYNAPFASGSNCPQQMVILPCSMSTVASIAHGIDQNLMHHAAGVILKEKKQLILVPRETPLSAIHLRNMLTLAELGVTLIPAMPGFYSGQSTFDDLINFVLQKVLNQLNIDLKLSKQWKEE